MNQDRRHIAEMCIELIEVSAEHGEISDKAHATLVKSVKHLAAQEYWQLKGQERHEGKNASTDKQLAVCRVALPALEAAGKALESDDWDTVISQLKLAISTDGSVAKAVKKTSKQRLRKSRA